MRVLYVEDSDTALQSFSLMLGEECSLTCVTTAADAVRVIREHQWDVVVLDYYLPGITNGEMVRMTQLQLMSHENQPKLIVFTSAAAKARAECRLDEVAFIQKYDWDRLREEMGL